MKTRLATGDMTDIAYHNSGNHLMHALNPAENFVDLSDEPYIETLMELFRDSVSDDKRCGGIPGNPSASRRLVL